MEKIPSDISVAQWYNWILRSMQTSAIFEEEKWEMKYTLELYS